ncbi:MAG: D-aminoacyl-tRNA deacylase [Halanaerobiales bacterium]
MRALIQRVSEARVKVDDNITGEINSGLLVFLGIGKEDGRKEAEFLADKIINLRVFPDNNDKMNLSAIDENKDLLIVSQFTLYGDCSQGRRPSFFEAASPEKAEELYHYFVDILKESDLRIETGRFKEMMDVELINDGPVTFYLDTEKLQE